MNISNCLRGIAHWGCHAAAAFALLLCAGSAGAQDICDYLNQALVRVALRIQTENIETDYDCVPGTSLLGAYLRQGGSQGLTVRLRAGQKYLVIGAGDQDIRDLNLTCVDVGNDDVIASDHDDGPLADIGFTPSRTGQYSINMTNADARDDGFCVFVILQRSSDNQFEGGQFGDALDKAIVAAKSICESSHFVPGGICLFGGKLARGGENSINNIRLESGEYVCRGASSENISDLDLFVENSTTNTVISKDIDPDNTPLCTFATRASNYYLLRTKVVDADSREGGYAFGLLMKR